MIQAANNVCQRSVDNQVKTEQTGAYIRVLPAMISCMRYSLFIVIVVFLLAMPEVSRSCTCVGKENQTTQSELDFVDVAVKGRVVAVSDLVYYDTATYALTGIKFDASKSGYLIRKFKRYTLVVDTKFKAAANLPDTLSIITGHGGGDCGFEFEIGSEYIVYGDAWKEKTVAVQHRKRKTKKRIVETARKAFFYTDICRLTQEANNNELENLQRLAKTATSR